MKNGHGSVEGTVLIFANCLFGLAIIFYISIFYTGFCLKYIVIQVN